MLAIRSMQISDLDKIVAIETQIYTFPWNKQVFTDCLNAKYIAKVLEKGEYLVAYALMSIVLDEANILNICVSPTQQGNGYGEKVLNYLLDLAEINLIQTIFLEVRASNKIAINLYKKLGFNQVGIRKNYYRNSYNLREDALIFTVKRRNY
ncbi:MAG: ribosomal protein S18-alanine N-acetyltransferase [Thiomargarita sp.]|nr:ribosomal protein S18-alanine N-acetyltransferase [Thiomargarita sp.]